MEDEGGTAVAAAGKAVACHHARGVDQAMRAPPRSFRFMLQPRKRRGRRGAAFVICRWAVLVPAIVATPHATAQLAIDAVVVDGRAFPFPARPSGGEPAPLRVSSSARGITFRFSGWPWLEGDGRQGPPPIPPADAATRLRFRLDGHDTRWRDPPASGRAIVSFIDAEGSVIGGLETTLAGETPGWNGSAATSAFLPRHLSAAAPPGVAGVQVAFLSHNAQQVVGSIGVDEVSLRRERPGMEAEVVTLPPRSPDSGDGSDGSLVRWRRIGSRPEMSLVMMRNEPFPHEILALLDDDPNRYGNWSTAVRFSTPLESGDRITLSWTTAHSLGVGGSAAAGYPNLAPGNYRFRVAAFRPDGTASTEEASLPLVVVPPFYRRREVWVAAAASLAAGAVLVGRSLAARRLKKRLEELERAQALDRERARIARDLHDEIGAGLSEIAMQADAVKGDVQAAGLGEALELTEGICRTAVDLVRSVDAIVWAVNPANDTLDRFAAYLVQSTEQFLDAAGITMRFDVPENLPAEPIAGAVRHRLFLAVRETLNNVARHAAARSVTVSLRRGTEAVEIEIVDDGRGFDPSAAPDGVEHNGLANMRQRLEEIGGVCTVDSRPGGGTRVRLSLPAGRMMPAAEAGTRGSHGHA